MSKQFQGKWKAASKRMGSMALPLRALPHYFMSVLSLQQEELILSGGGCLRYLFLKQKAESSTFQGSSKASIR